MLWIILIFFMGMGLIISDRVWYEIKKKKNFDPELELRKQVENLVLTCLRGSRVYDYRFSDFNKVYRDHVDHIMARLFGHIVLGKEVTTAELIKVTQAVFAEYRRDLCESDTSRWPS
jgi:hypothetical protein